VLNVYGPYMDKVEYFYNFFKKDYIQNGLLVIGGDLIHFRTFRGLGPDCIIELPLRVICHKIGRIWYFGY
jgi:hypothetical protein